MWYLSPFVDHTEIEFTVPKEDKEMPIREVQDEEVMVVIYYREDLSWKGRMNILLKRRMNVKKRNCYIGITWLLQMEIVDDV